LEFKSILLPASINAKNQLEIVKNWGLEVGFKKNMSCRIYFGTPLTGERLTGRPQGISGQVGKLMGC